MADPTPIHMTTIENLKLNIPEVAQDLTRMALNGAPKGTTPDKVVGYIVDRTWDVALHASMAILIVTAGWLISSWLASRTQHIFVKMHMEETLAAFLGSMLRFLVFFSALIAAVMLVGVNTTSMAAVLGATGLAVGLALKGTLGHVASGVMLMAHRPFRVGDWVETTGGMQGNVKRIGIFSTEVNSIDNRRLFIPNSNLWENVIQNHSYNRTRMIEFKVPLNYLDDIEKGIDVIKATLDADPCILKMPAPIVGITAFQALAAECSIRVWFKREDYVTVQFGTLGHIKTALDEAGFHFPMQSQTNPDVFALERVEKADKAQKIQAENAGAKVLPKTKDNKEHSHKTNN